MSRPRKLLVWLSQLALAGVAMGLALLVVEVAVRFVPALLPAGIYGSGKTNPELGMGVHGGTLIYNKVRHVTRQPNADGFLDVDHARVKPAGTFRIGFFGDSYVEAAQVEQADVFYRRLGDRLGAKQIETLGFGMSGWGTLHGMLAHRIYAPIYDLDAVVYVFVENDPGDNSFEIQDHSSTSKNKPFAVLSDQPPGFALQWSSSAIRNHWYTPPIKWLQSHSMLVQLVLDRYQLLASRGVKTKAEAKAFDMTERSKGAIPVSNETPDSWPAPYREHAGEIFRHVLRQWRDEVQARGTPFFVLYVPRGESQLTGDLESGSTWRPLLDQVTAELGIPLIDPTDELRQRLAAGDHVYDDHFTPVGHEVVEGVLEARLGGLARRPASVASGASGGH